MNGNGLQPPDQEAKGSLLEGMRDELKKKMEGK